MSQNNSKFPVSKADEQDIEAIFSRSRDTRQLSLKAPWRCNNGWHSWSMWRTRAKGDVTSGDDRVGFYTTRERICLRCGKEEMRKVTG